MSGAALEAVDHALIRLSRGDTSAVEALPIEAFLDPVARPDPQHAGLARRWTMALPAALARLDPAARTRALIRLDARYHTLAGNRSGVERARLASAFLPAPDAMKDLLRASDRAFDLGRFDDYLGMAWLLAASGRTEDDVRRQEVALQLSGLGPQVDASLHLASPGTPVPTAATGVVPRVVSRNHLVMRWLVVPGWVLACDPFAQVVWQYRVDRLAQVTTGPGAVMVRDSSGLRALADDGTVTVLPPLPSGATVLTIAGGAAWFATGDRAWRLVLASNTIQALDLAAPPLGAPIVRGPQSLWLTARELLLFDGERLLHRFQHRLPAASGWHLGIDGDRPLVLDGESRTWRLESFSDQFDRLSGADRAELLLQARRPAEALTLLGEPLDERARKVALRAHLATAAGRVSLKKAAVLALCRSEQDSALVLLTNLGAGEPPDRGPLRRVLDALPATAPDAEALDHLAKKDPALLLSDVLSDLADDPTLWDHACSGSAWTRWRLNHLVIPTPGDGPLVRMEAEQVAVGNATTTRLVDGTLTVGDRLYRLDRGIDAISLTCHAQSGALLWRHRWRPLTFLSAPSQSLEVRADAVLVLEGGMRLNVFDPLLGVRRGTFVIEDLGSGTAHVLTSSLAIVGPLGIDNVITLLTEHGPGMRIPLDSPARWVVAIGDHLLVKGRDGVARLYPGGRTIDLPADLKRSTTPPSVSRDGLHLATTMWRWAR